MGKGGYFESRIYPKCPWADMGKRDYFGGDLLKMALGGNG
jgi:hypothetical protein